MYCVIYKPSGEYQTWLTDMGYKVDIPWYNLRLKGKGKEKNNNHVINKHMVCVPMGRGYVQNKNDCNEWIVYITLQICFHW